MNISRILRISDKNSPSGHTFKSFSYLFWSVKIRNFKIQIKDKFSLAKFFFCLRIFAFLKSQLEEVLKNKQKTPKFHAIYSTLNLVFFQNNYAAHQLLIRSISASQIRFTSWSGESAKEANGNFVKKGPSFNRRRRSEGS